MEQALLEGSTDRHSLGAVPSDQRWSSPRLDCAHGATRLLRRRLLPLPALKGRQRLCCITEVLDEPRSGSRSLVSSHVVWCNEKRTRVVSIRGGVSRPSYAHVPCLKMQARGTGGSLCVP